MFKFIAALVLSVSFIFASTVQAEMVEIDSVELAKLVGELAFVKQQHADLGKEAMRIIKEVELNNEILRSQLRISERVKTEFIHKYTNAVNDCKNRGR